MILYQKSTEKNPPVKRVGQRGGGKVIAALLMTLMLLIAQAAGQGFSSSGGPVGGGGSSSASGYAITGNVPLMPGGVSTSTGYIITGGTIIHIANNALSAYYAGDLVQTVPSSQRMMIVNYEGGSGDPVTGRIYYRYGGQTTYSNALMTDEGNGLLTYTLSANLLGVRGLEYYFTAEQDGHTTTVGSPDNPYIFRVSLTNAQGQRPTALPDASYRIIGLPLNPTSSNATNVFVDDLGSADSTMWRLGSYNHISGEVQEFPSVPAVTPGEGYWLIARDGKRYGSEGTTMRPNYTYGGAPYYEVVLDSGWNMLANPLPFNVAFGEIYFDTNGVVVPGHPASVIDDAAYYYNGSGYTTVATIPAWEGVFLHVNRSGVSALVPYHEAVPGSPVFKPLVNNLTGNEWSLELVMRTGDKIDAGNLVGVKYDAEETADKYDFNEPPPAPDAPYLALKIPGDNNNLRMTDFRPEFEDGAVWTLEMAPANNRILTLKGFEGMSDWQIALEFDTKTIVYPTEEQAVAVPENATSARLIIGNKAYLAGEQAGLPDNFALEQNYPNPFNPVTSIRFIVPAQTHVRLNIHNILGQEVKSLVDETVPRGEYTVTWDGTDENNQPVASGIYFYRIQAEGYSQCRKMLLLK